MSPPSESASETPPRTSRQVDFWPPPRPNSLLRRRNTPSVLSTHDAANSRLVELAQEVHELAAAVAVRHHAVDLALCGRSGGVDGIFDAAPGACPRTDVRRHQLAGAAMAAALCAWLLKDDA